MTVIRPLIRPLISDTLRRTFKRSAHEYGVHAAVASGMLLGMNLSGIGNYNGSLPFANLMWQSSLWELESETNANTTVWTQKRGVLTVTAVTGTAVFRKVLYDDSLKYLADYMPNGTYTAKNANGTSFGIGDYGSPSFAGVGFSTTTSDRPFHYDSSMGLMALHMQVTTTGSFGAGIQVLIPGHDGSDYFNSQFIAFMLGLGASGGPIRFLDWQVTNTNPDTDWADRSLPTDPALDPSSGVPWEVCFALCNRLNRDPWCNIPARATDAYVTSFCNLALSTLNAGRNVWWERGNELWNTASDFFMNTQWVNYGNHPRYAATVDPTAGVITHAAHGFANGDVVLPFATRKTVSNGINGGTASANNNYYFAHSGLRCSISDATTDTFRVKQLDEQGVIGPYITFPPIRGAGNYATNSVTDLIYVKESDAGLIDIDDNYAARCVSDWSIADSILGSSRVKAIMATQVASIDANGIAQRAVKRLAVTGANRYNYLAGAPYYVGDWFIGAVDVASGKFTPKFWTTGSGTTTLHYGVYVQGSAPFNYEVENGTGTGFVAHSSYSLAYASRLNAPVTITNASPAVVTLDTVAPAAGNSVTFATTGALPAGLTAGTGYFVINPSGNTFQVSATNGGAAINTTGAGSGTHTANASYGASSYIPGASVAAVNGTTYTHCFVLIDSKGYRWRMNKDIAASATTSTAEVTDSYANHSLRELLNMHDYNMPLIAGHQAAIATSGNPSAKFINYEFAPSNQDYQSSAPAAALTWLRQQVLDPSHKAVEKINLMKQAANGVSEVSWFEDVSAYGVSWTTAPSHYATTDPRYVGLAEFAGTVPVYTQLTQVDIPATAITSVPSLPYVVTALPADGTTYSVVKATPSADQYDVSGGNLRLLSNLGINYAATSPQTIRLRKADGKTDIFFNVNVSTGPLAWWESDALYAWSSIMDTDTAAINPVVGNTLTLNAGSGATISGGLWDMAGTSSYGNSADALISTPDLTKDFLYVQVANQGTETGYASQVSQCGSFPNFMGCIWANSARAGWFLDHDPQQAFPDTGPMDATTRVYWFWYRASDNKYFSGYNQTIANPSGASGDAVTITFPALSRAMTYSNHLFKVGSTQIVNRAGLTQAAVLAIVQKVQTHHGI